MQTPFGFRGFRVSRSAVCRQRAANPRVQRGSGNPGVQASPGLWARYPHVGGAAVSGTFSLTANLAAPRHLDMVSRRTPARAVSPPAIVGQVTGSPRKRLLVRTLKTGTRLMKIDALAAPTCSMPRR